MSASDHSHDHSTGWLSVSPSIRHLVYLIALFIFWYILFHRILTRFCTCKKLKNPAIVNVPKYEDDIWPLRCSHRGGAAEQPENSIRAFKNSLRNNIKYLECDIHLTKDDEVVIAHDYSL